MAGSFTPDGGQRVDDQGHVTYDFTGHVHAAGLDLDAGADSAPPDDRRVRWLTESGGVVAQVYGTRQGTHNLLVAKAGDPANVNDANFEAQAASTAGAALLDLIAGATGVSVRAAAAGKSATVIDNLGRSSFLFSVGGVAIRVNMGSFPGVSFGGGAGAFVTIAHGLGGSPSGSIGGAQVGVTASDTQAVFSVGVYSWDATNITYKLLAPA